MEKALQDGLTRAGFSDVRVEEMTLTLEFPSAEDCIRYLMEVSPAFAALLSGKSPGQQQRYRQTLADRLRQYLSVDGGIRIPNATICAVGRR